MESHGTEGDNKSWNYLSRAILINHDLHSPDVNLYPYHFDVMYNFLAWEVFERCSKAKTAHSGRKYDL
jgi:hypothetical protein